MRRFIPVACVGRRLPAFRLRVDNRRSLHCLVIDNAEVGAVLRDGSPGIAIDRADENSVSILQIVEPQIAREAEESPLWMVLRQSGK